MMEKNTKKMMQMVNQILDFRKIQNGKMRLHVSLFNLNEMVDSFEKEFRVMAEENEVSFTFQLAGEDIMVWADKEKVAIVIRNIISNAFKFTPAGGNIYVTMGVSDDDKHCYVRVEDSGVGIPQSKLSEIFERFSQADNARGAYYQGTGIGLALSKEIISLHHGEIYAESPEGKGAVFTIELQLGKKHYKPSEVDFYMGGETVSVPETESVSASAGKESEEEKEQPVDSSLPTVLIVEDNTDLCNMLKLQLEDKFNIYMANDGVEGLKKVHLYHPDMVVTDQMMPNMDGIEMLTNSVFGNLMVEVAESIAYGLNREFIVLVRNEEIIPNFEKNAIIEVAGTIGKDGAKGYPYGEIPLFYKGLMEGQYAYEQLTVDAFREKNYEKALMALTVNRTVVDPGKAKAVLDDLMEVNREYWYLQ